MTGHCSQFAGQPGPEERQCIPERRVKLLLPACAGLCRPAGCHACCLFRPLSRARRKDLVQAVSGKRGRRSRRQCWIGNRWLALVAGEASDDHSARTRLGLDRINGQICGEDYNVVRRLLFFLLLLLLLLVVARHVFCLALGADDLLAVNPHPRVRGEEQPRGGKRIIHHRRQQAQLGFGLGAVSAVLSDSFFGR